MESSSPLVIAMAQECRRLIQESEVPDQGLPKALGPAHLLWMCTKIEEHAEDGSPTKLHRWIGFMQGAMLANRMLDLDGLKAMFSAAKSASRESTDDTEDLLDHLNPDSLFEFDIGGQG